MDPLVQELIARRAQHCFPRAVQATARSIGQRAMAVLFPHFAETVECDEVAISAEVVELKAELNALMDTLADRLAVPPPETADLFLQCLPSIFANLDLDARAIYAGDPAATSTDEVILTYPGFYAIAIHRIAHQLTLLEYPLLPRLLSEHAHQTTGIDIHPAAQIGRSFFIDHGTGVVIGETAVIGNGVKLYQGVTLGALSVEKIHASNKRHPTLEDHVVVYANATILGGETIIGHDSVVGGNAWVTKSVSPFSMVGRNTTVRRRALSVDDGEFVI